jgi:hypothetical protein
MKIDIYKASLITNYKRKKEKQVCSEKNGTKNRGSQDTIENEKIKKRNSDYFRNTGQKKFVHREAVVDIIWTA